MTILAFGTTIAELDREGLTNAGWYVYTTNASQIAPYVDEGIEIKPRSVSPDPSTTNAIGFDLSSASADFWVSYSVYAANQSGSNRDWPEVEIFGNGVELFRVGAANGIRNLAYHNGSSWQIIGTFGIFANTVQRVDLHIVMHETTGTLTAYVNGTEQTGATYGPADTILRGESTADEVRFGNGDAGAVSYTSACFVSDTDSRAIEYVQTAIDGAGAETDWTGAYTDIDEAGVNVGDLIQAANNAEKATYTFAALPTFSSAYTVVGIGVTARATRGSTGPQNLQLAIRENVTNGFSGNKALTDFWEEHHHFFALNPDTASAWTFAEADAAEVGVQAIT